jgi:tetratricopeptide (TPR) repeat protein
MEKTDKRFGSHSSEDTALGRFIDEYYPRYARQIWGLLAVAIVAVVGYFGWSWSRDRAEEAAGRRLGEAYVHLRDNNLPAAEAALVGVLADHPSGLSADKANLYLGKLYYAQQRYAQAAETYAKVKKRSRAPLVYSGALHGRAAALMQQGDYAGAATLLEELVHNYGKRTGNPKESLDEEQVADLAPSVPNALFKLALCYRETGSTEKAKATAEKLVRAYPDTREGRDGALLLGVLE